MASPRDIPNSIRTALNLVALLGVAATFLGWVQTSLGVVIVIVAFLYLLWELAPWLAQKIHQRPLTTLAVFMAIGCSVGALFWYIMRKTVPANFGGEIKAHAKNILPEELPNRTKNPDDRVAKNNLLYEAKDELLDVGKVMPQLRALDLPAPEDRAKRDALIERTNVLAKRLIDFADERDELVKRFTSDFWASAQEGRLPPKPWEDRERDFNASIEEFHKEAENRVSQLYWPSVLKITEELAASGVDISPVSRASALNGPRYIGLRLSLLATRVGKEAPFQRELTPLMARAVVKGLNPANFEVSAFGRDNNSVRMAQNLREAMLNEGWQVGEVRLLYPVTAPIPRGVKVIYPYADVASLDDIGYAIRACQIDVATEVRQDLQLNSIPLKSQAMIWGKIEVWPEPIK